MAARIATCACGRLTARCEGEALWVSVCHCLDCQRRSGSAFAAQARFPTERVAIEGETTSYVRTADSGKRATFRFCPACGATIAYQIDDQPEVTAVPLGAFADPGFGPPPAYSVYETRMHAWLAIVGENIDHFD